MEHIKLQAGCLLILLYIALIYRRESKKYGHDAKMPLFGKILSLSILNVLLDGITAFTVNNRSLVPDLLNTVLHALFLISIDSVIFALFLYMLHITGAFPESRSKRILVFLPFGINVAVVVFTMNKLEYINGTATAYSMGLPAYTCFVMAAFYIITSLFTFLKRWHYIESHKRASILTYLLALSAITGIQMIFPETLISCLAATVLIIGIYMNTEDPSLNELAHFHTETVMSFANLIENRDNNTGGHIKRTSRYVEIIANELLSKGHHSEILTKDYVTNLLKAAPMHDIGKISVPDAVLRKPGRLTDEEFTQMKKHAENGGDIIRETFRNLGDEDFRRMAFEVARYHHEKWNGRGYPDGLEQEEIPLCARIMAVADVFDAVSEKRCYRDAMPLEQCFEIIRQGSGQDFDPLIAEIFLESREKVEKVHAEFAAAQNSPPTA
ncbi:MAG: HD domain-containing protein [Oscillospiraceae bacterium]|nr:HD domain-containing protein [Oscillospiraceae bacterium]